MQRLFHPDSDGTAHCYLLHPPGGVVLGDEIAVDAAVSGGHALLTTPSAGRFYGVGNHREVQQQTVSLRATANSKLSWLPQETILFSGADARLATTITIAETARLCWWDILVLGRPASGEHFDTGRLEQQLRVSIAENLVLEERLAFSAGDRITVAPMGLGGASTIGTFIMTRHAPESQLDNWLISVNGETGVGCFSVTQRGPLLLARYRGDDAQHCRQGFSELWRAIPPVDGDPVPSEPRIWHT